VFAAFAREKLLASWWGPDGFRNEFDLFEFRNGGRWRFVMIGPDGSRYRNETMFSSIEPPGRLVLHHVSAPVFILTIELREVEGGTHIDWDQVFEDPAVAAAIEHIVVPANEQNLDRLGAVLGTIQSDPNREAGDPGA
jgi:uncharacterized protein YndB with AHSA1/START domain